MKPFPKIEGVKLYLAGGFVRDHLLDLPSNDRDFVAVTDLSFGELVEAVDAIGEVFQAKDEFLTIRCKIGNEILDIVMPRSENNYTDGRHPDEVTKVSTLKEDSSRRDFTINSMYMDENEEITDYHNGQRDLKEDTICCVGDPDKRFKEDALRILRAIRFKIKYGFGIAAETYIAMENNIKGLTKISTDRIRDEINKMLLISPFDTMYALNRLGILEMLGQWDLWFKLTNEKRKKT